MDTHDQRMQAHLLLDKKTKNKKNITQPKFEMIKLLEKYRLYKKGKPLLSVKHLSQFLDDLNGIVKSQIIKNIILYDCSTRKDFTDYRLVLKKYYEKIKKKQNNSEVDLDYDHKEKHLKLSGKGIDQLFWNACGIFSKLPVKTLDISHSTIHNHRELIFKNIETLDIRNSLFRNLSFLKSFKQLKTVLITPGQFPNKTTMAKLPHIQLVEKKSD